MFVKSVKVKKTGLITVIFFAAMILALIFIVFFACKTGKKQVYELNSETKRQEFLTQMGWEVSDEYDQCKAVTIPEEFNEVYQKYNELQKQQGFDLEKYKGKNIEVYTYNVKNYPGYEDKEGIICNLMVYEGQLIGGDVCSTELEGFMQGLRKQEENS